MGKKKYLSGTSVFPQEPTWEPLRDFGGEWLLGNFMAMFEVELETGTRLYAYKHIDTRRYIHIDSDGNAYVYVGAGPHAGKYKPLPFWEAFDQVIRDADFETGWISRAHYERGPEEDEEADLDTGRRWPVSRFIRGYVTTDD